MNSRGQVVDAWRQIAVYANALLGTFTVQYQLNANSPLGAAQPTNIGGSGNAHQLILNTQLPLVRIQERNNYRASLIAYQRQRRTVQEAEDLAVQVVNSEMYQLRHTADQYKLQQRQLELAYLTIDSSLESLEAPTAPPAPPGQTASRSGADGPAALTQQLLTCPTLAADGPERTANHLDQLPRSATATVSGPRTDAARSRGVWIDQIRDCDCSVNPEQPAGPVLTPPPAEPRPVVPQQMPLASEVGKR